MIVVAIRLDKDDSSVTGCDLHVLGNVMVRWCDCNNSLGMRLQLWHLLVAWSMLSHHSTSPCCFVGNGMLASQTLQMLFLLIPFAAVRTFGYSFAVKEHCAASEL